MSSNFRAKQAIQLSNDNITTIVILLQLYFCENIADEQISHVDTHSIRLIRKLRKIAANNTLDKVVNIDNLGYIQATLSLLEQGIARELYRIKSLMSKRDKN